MPDVGGIAESVKSMHGGNLIPQLLISGNGNHEANASPLDIFGSIWFFTFGGIKLSFPSFDNLRSRRRRARRLRLRLLPLSGEMP
jgi:hypothetical protein